MSEKPRALMLLGPTACGKTAVSLMLAREFAAEIISVDSALIYRGMDIGTAKPTKEEQGGVPHHLIDILDIEESYSAAAFAEDAERLIGEISGRDRYPLLVGGTMLYAKALREGMDESPATDPAVRERITALGEELGWPAMHERLTQVDPITAARLAPNDRQRVGRALEVFEITGKPLSSLHTGAKRYDPTLAVAALFPQDRAKLHEMIGKRFDAMVKAGFLDEVRTLMARPGFDESLPSMRAVGYRQAIAHLKGEIDFNQFLESGKAATRQLAKRQITWLRSMPGVVTFDPYETPLTTIKDKLRQMADPNLD